MSFSAAARDALLGPVNLKPSATALIEVPPRTIRVFIPMMSKNMGWISSLGLNSYHPYSATRIMFLPEIRYFPLIPGLQRIVWKEKKGDLLGVSLSSPSTESTKQANPIKQL